MFKRKSKYSPSRCFGDNRFDELAVSSKKSGEIDDVKTRFVAGQRDVTVIYGVCGCITYMIVETFYKLIHICYTGTKYHLQ